MKKSEKLTALKMSKSNKTGEKVAKRGKKKKPRQPFAAGGGSVVFQEEDGAFDVVAHGTVPIGGK